MTNKNELPRPIIYPSQKKEGVHPKVDLEKLFKETLPQIVRSFERSLKGDSPYYQVKELDISSLDDIQKHLSNLDQLDILLTQFGTEPSSLVTRSVGREEGNFKVILASSLTRPGDSSETAETQINFFVRDFEENNETRDEQLLAASMKGVAPQSVIDRVERQMVTSMITINTRGYYTDKKTGNYGLIPKPGIQLLKVGKVIKLLGLTNLGAQQPNLDIPYSPGISIDEFNALHDYLYDISVDY